MQAAGEDAEQQYQAWPGSCWKTQEWWGVFSAMQDLAPVPCPEHGAMLPCMVRQEPHKHMEACENEGMTLGGEV